MNPFSEKPMPLLNFYENWKQMYPEPYDKTEVDPYTKTRIILMNGTEFESNWFSHQFSRHVADTNIRRELAMARGLEKQQQLKISLLKPYNESVLEHTISYEQLAIDLTAHLAQREKNFYVKKALDFALLEDFDHLYRYADLLQMTEGVAAERLVGRYTEIMPGRPTIAHHRCPTDNVRRSVSSKTADKETVLATMIITAAEQQTMNYYMNVTNFAPGELARRLYQEIALVEEEHVTQYEALIDATGTWFEMLLWHEYTECYLYWSCYSTETDNKIRSWWEENLAIEIAHLHKAAQLLQKYENKEWQEVIAGGGEFPEPLSLHENIDYVRSVLGATAQYTSVKEDYENIDNLQKNADYFKFQHKLNTMPDIVPSHNVIKTYIEREGIDYRYETQLNPVSQLRDRTEDNVTVGVKPGSADSCRGFFENGKTKVSVKN